MKDIDIFLAAVKAEYHRAVAKFPGNEQQNVALMEEVGELANAMLDLNYGKLKRPTEAAHSCEVFKEATQVAAVAAKIAIFGDSWCPKYDAKHALRIALSESKGGSE